MPMLLRDGFSVLGICMPCCVNWRFVMVAGLAVFLRRFLWEERH